MSRARDELDEDELCFLEEAGVDLADYAPLLEMAVTVPDLADHIDVNESRVS
jgi:hypothetical protein